MGARHRLNYVSQLLPSSIILESRALTSRFYLFNDAQQQEPNGMVPARRFG
jgi:hypothetical protein